MLTNPVELETYVSVSQAAETNERLRGPERMFRHAFFVHIASIYVGTPALAIAEQVVLPADRATVLAKLSRGLCWEMRLPERSVVRDKIDGRKVSFIWLAPPTDLASSPARVYEFPLAPINADCVPSMRTLEGRKWLAHRRCSVAYPFAVTTDDNAFETCLECDSVEQPSISFADSHTRGQSASRSRGLNAVIVKRIGIVVNVMVQPHKDDSSAVRK